jgi:pentatricopeptide repeat protein
VEHRGSLSVLNEMPSHNMSSYTVMIYEYAKCGQLQKALEIFQEMQHKGVQPECLTFVWILTVCRPV